MVYRVKTYIAGKVQSFTVEADSEREAIERTYEKTGAERTTILSVTPAERGVKDKKKKSGRVKPKDLELFCRQMNALISSGITVLEAIETLSDTENRRLRTILKEAADNIKAGFSLSSSLGGYPDVFDTVFISTIRAAEESGSLESALLWLADNYKRTDDFKRKLKQAITYPSIVVAFAIIVAVGLFTFVVPKFAQMLTQGGVKIPLITQIMLYISSHFMYFAAGFLGLIFLLFVIFKLLKKNERIFAKVELKMLGIPVIGRIFRLMNLAKIFWVLTLLIQAGIRLDYALEIVQNLTGFVSLRREFETARLTIEKGGTLSAGLADSEWIPPAELKMVTVGERSGNLEKMTEQAASLLDKETDVLLEKLPPLIETFTTMLVGVGVLVILLSLFLPMVSMYQTIK
ncbi:type II secretion system F family protein [Caldanaerobius fijiensis]|uniref:type II secretion system F family protein n=1 Tax=Caldanaerobius fijiensis TaxID=456330 RepID=UPI0013565832|nr:type II secretion system F family protein [Caldanaerobius fijiensis]